MPVPKDVCQNTFTNSDLSSIFRHRNRHNRKKKKNKQSRQPKLPRFNDLWVRIDPSGWVKIQFLGVLSIFLHFYCNTCDFLSILVYIHRRYLILKLNTINFTFIFLCHKLALELFWNELFCTKCTKYTISNKYTVCLIRYRTLARLFLYTYWYFEISA